MQQLQGSIYLLNESFDDKFSELDRHLSNMQQMFYDEINQREQLSKQVVIQFKFSTGIF